MPRTQPLTRIDIPQIKPPRHLSQMYSWHELLGHDKPPPAAERELAHSIALSRASPNLAKGLTLHRQADDLKRCAKALRRERPGHPETKVRQRLADPHFGWDTEMWLRLEPLMNAPAPVLATEVEACRRDLMKMKEVDPRFRTLVTTAGTATMLFLTHAKDERLNSSDKWWEFVLAFLHAADFEHEALHKNPGRLRPMLDKLREQILASGLLQYARGGGREDAA